jgi:tripartite-type tricarboxylate transporter receptor subunit TctC
MKHLVLLLVSAVLGFASAAAQAAWPERPVKFIVPFPAGGPADNALRVVGKRLNEIWGQPVVIENRPGAPGMVFTASAAPDGYTLVLGAGSHIVTAPLMNTKLAYKPQRDFTPVSLLLTNTPLLAVHPSVPVKSVKDLIAYAKANPGSLNYSSAGLGSPSHLMMEMFEDVTGTKFTHVPYKGGAPAVQELIAGHVQLGANATPTVLQYINAGKLNALAVASSKRDRSLPNVPTMAESGVQNMEYVVWYGVFAPAKTPKPIVEKISADMQKVLSEPDVVATLRAQGADPEGLSPANFEKMIRADLRIWGKLIKDKKLSLDE